MNEIKFAGDFNQPAEGQIEELRSAAAAAAATDGLRVLRDLEMGWIAGGDANTTWV
jgi:hypothetical protein